MFVHFTFESGNNPYIARTNYALWKMVEKYHLEQEFENGFHVLGYRPSHKAYEDKKEALREFAIEWQHGFGDVSYSWGDLSDWQDFFTEYGKKYGLLREFRENAIC